MLLLSVGACGGEDTAAEACVHSPYNGLEPACSFEAGPGNNLLAPADNKLPTPTGECPGFVAGEGCVEANGGLTCTFNPAGQSARTARVWMPPGGNGASGPLVLYFYGLLGFPDNAVSAFSGFPPAARDRLFAEGGLLVAPQHREDRNPVSFSRLPWIGALGLDTDSRDFELVDEIVACAIEKLSIDVRRIHSTGLSAGGWMTGQVMVQRSNYIASAALFSGGLEDIGNLQDATNKFPVAMFHGGTSDYVGAHFQNEAQSGVNLLRSLDHFAVNCNHGGGHSVPANAAIAGMQFMLDHPYGTLRSSYCDTAPTEASFCALTTEATLGVIPESNRAEADVTACTDRALQMGIMGERFTDELTTCACERCGTAFAACLDNPDCAEALKCGAEKGCLGVSCSQEFLCSPVIESSGSITGAGPQLAVAFADCVSAAACDHCGVPTMSAP